MRKEGKDSPTGKPGTRSLWLGHTDSAIVIALVLFFAELVLRLMPSLISVAVLEKMHPSLRSEIAAQLGLPTTGEYVVIESAQRSDGGPDLFISKPNQPWSQPHLWEWPSAASKVL